MLFGTVIDGTMHANAAGQIAQSVWQSIPAHRPQVELDVFVIMPNHIHGLLWIADDPTVAVPSLSTIVGGYKAEVTRQIRRLMSDASRIIWQGRFHDNIIRTQVTLDRIRAYVAENPQRWSEDTFYAE